MSSETLLRLQKLSNENKLEPSKELKLLLRLPVENNSFENEIKFLI